MELSGFNTKIGPIFENNLKEGKYMFSLSGFYINEQLYNGYNDDLYD